MDLEGTASVLHAGKCGRYHLLLDTVFSSLPASTQLLPEEFGLCSTLKGAPLATGALVVFPTVSVQQFVAGWITSRLVGSLALLRAFAILETLCFDE